MALTGYRTLRGAAGEAACCPETRQVAQAGRQVATTARSAGCIWQPATGCAVLHEAHEAAPPAVSLLAWLQPLQPRTCRWIRPRCAPPSPHPPPAARRSRCPPPQSCCSWPSWRRPSACQRPAPRWGWPASPAGTCRPVQKERGEGGGDTSRQPSRLSTSTLLCFEGQQCSALQRPDAAATAPPCAASKQATWGRRLEHTTVEAGGTCLTHRQAIAADDRGGVDLGPHQVVGALQQLCGNNHHARGAVTHLQGQKGSGCTINGVASQLELAKLGMAGGIPGSPPWALHPQAATYHVGAQSFAMQRNIQAKHLNDRTGLQDHTAPAGRVCSPLDPAALPALPESAEAAGQGNTSSQLCTHRSQRPAQEKAE